MFAMASSTGSPIDLLKVISKFRTLTERPTDFLSKDQLRSENFKNLSKTFFDHVRICKNIPHSAALPELLIGPEFDDEQVWQQLELDNKLSIDTAVKNVANLLVQGEPEFFGVAAGSSSRNGLTTAESKNDQESGIESHEEESEEGDHHFKNGSDFDENEEDEEDDEAIARENEGDNENELDEDEDEEEEEEEGEEDKEEEKAERPRPSGPPSALDDQFFKLSDMNDFILEDEKRGNRPAGEEIDYFADHEEESERDEEDYRYDDFFDPIQSTTPKPSNAKKVEKSTFEKRQEKLQDRIKTMEEEAVAAKPWQLGGEISAGKRPENSLLEEFLQFDHVMRQPPVITEEVSQKLEDLILQRIKDKAWDDVERKAKPKDVDAYEYKKKLVLEETKAKQSLSQIYEEEFLKKMASGEKEEEKTENVAIRKSLNDLFVKLDALSNFHFVPKPVAPEIKIVNNLPTLVVEDIQPATVATSTLLAPEEIHSKKNSQLTGLTEASETDKNRSRRKKKLRQKIKAQHQKGKEDILEKKAKKMEKVKNKSGSSGAFFDKLQDTVRAEQASKNIDGKESKKRKKNVIDAKTVKKFKL